ncbi:MAG: ECF transporter S component [Tissierellaceae bacterium]|nr:ECF transporter S component [Tissierellaceae bacterium]
MDEVKNDRLILITRYAVMLAITVVMTMIIHIPILGTKGYLNLGDMVVFLAAVMFGKKGGFVVGGLGSALADILLGYSYYAPITFVVKGLEGFFCAALLETKTGKKLPFLPMIIGGVWMALGYYIAEIFMYGAKAALISMPANLIQGVVGAVLAIALKTALKKTRIFNL